MSGLEDVVDRMRVLASCGRGADKLRRSKKDRAGQRATFRRLLGRCGGAGEGLEGGGLKLGGKG